MAVLSAAGILTAAAPQFGILNTASTVYAKATRLGRRSMVHGNSMRRVITPLLIPGRKYGNDWYYLNEDGEIATSQEIDEYYVDETGKLSRLSNYWVSVTQ